MEFLGVTQILVQKLITVSMLGLFCPCRVRAMRYTFLVFVKDLWVTRQNKFLIIFPSQVGFFDNDTFVVKNHRIIQVRQTQLVTFAFVRHLNGVFHVQYETFKRSKPKCMWTKCDTAVRLIRGSHIQKHNTRHGSITVVIVIQL